MILLAVSVASFILPDSIRPLRGHVITRSPNHVPTLTLSIASKLNLDIINMVFVSLTADIYILARVAKKQYLCGAILISDDSSNDYFQKSGL